MATDDMMDQASLLLKLAQGIGISEPALRLLLSTFIGFPLAVFFRDNLHGTSASTKHYFVTAVGLAISYFNFGMDTGYLLFPILLNYVLLSVIGGTLLSVAISFAFNMGYLILAYIFLSTDDYDMIWTTPQCILTLRMISVAYDLYDGNQPVEKLSSEQKGLCFKEAPTLLEILSYSFFFGYMLSGPQFPLRKYREYIEGRLSDNEEGKPSDTTYPALRCLAVAVFYVIVEATIAPLFTEHYLLTQEFADSSFFYKLLYIALFGKFVINKYILFWILTESVCILSGLAYSGKDEKGVAKWTSCSGVHPYDFETGTQIKTMIASFNISTNVWFGRYIYKRLKFLGNRYISQVVTLFFLAIWHGIHIGYLNNFFLEFFIVMFELQATEIFQKVPILNKISSHPALTLVKFAILKWGVHFMMGYPLVSFVLLKWYKSNQVYSQLYYVGHIFFLSWPFLSLGFIMPRLKAQQRKKEREAAKTE